jgi:hypothetical protein
MGQFSVEKPGLPGSVLSGNQHRERVAEGPTKVVAIPHASYSDFEEGR